MYVIQFITILSWYGLVNICLCYRRIKTQNCRFSLLHSPNIFAAGLCLTTATWRCRKNFSQWELSFLWKLRCHWLKGLRQRQIAVVRQGPEHNIRDRCRASWIVKQYESLLTGAATNHTNRAGTWRRRQRHNRHKYRTCIPEIVHTICVSFIVLW